MASKKSKGLGRGLEALLGGSADFVEAPAVKPEQGNSLPLTQLQPGKYQPRTRMDEGALAELADSIRAQGIMQPILVRPVAAERYEIIAGERRFRAAGLAGLEQVPVLIREVDDKTAAAMALIENIQREDLNPLEEAQGIQRLIHEFGFTHEQAAQSVGRSRSAVSNLLRLLNLAKPVQTMLMAGDLDMGHARALLALDGAQQITMANEINAKRMSVREAEKLVTRAQQEQSERPLRKLDKSADLKTLEEELSDLLAMPVSFKMSSASKGQMQIAFGDLDQLDHILAKLRA
ncbi:ParB/RepB/Spo0J family partition protein [Massilia sp. W12]|uniref:ParB/RepB/Spo0J family partition protein n=1 Tax=Massilia sp. W12 TaxID=3126507 RepID=UPI0030D1C4D9